MSFKPFPYQIDGANWLASRKVGLLADEMGLGKTAQAILAADLIDAKRVLVVCPAIARFNWFREFEKVSSQKRCFAIITKTRAYWSPTTSLITSFEGAASVIDQGGPFDALIIDEAHYLKNPASIRTKQILGKNGIVKNARHVWALTGTPAPNDYSELWPLLFTFGATKLQHKAFIERYCETRETAYGLQIVGRKVAMVPELKAVTQKVMLRRMKVNVMPELPPIVFSNFIIEAGKIEVLSNSGLLLDFLNSKDLMQKVESEKLLVEAILKNELAFNDLQALEACAKSVSTLRRYTGLQKVHEVSELIAMELELNAYKKIVIFGIHTEVIEGLLKKLKAFNAVGLYGGISDTQKQKNIDRFQSDPACRVVVANIRTAGTAVTLTAANQVAFIEVDWSPVSNAQASSRCHRIGQRDSVFVRFFSLNTFIDERVNDVLLRKTKDLAELFEYVD